MIVTAWFNSQHHMVQELCDRVEGMLLTTDELNTAKWAIMPVGFAVVYKTTRSPMVILEDWVNEGFSIKDDFHQFSFSGEKK